MVILGMDAFEIEIAFHFAKLRIRSVRPAGEVGIDNGLEYITALEIHIPVIIIGFIEKIQPVQAFHPADTHLNIKIALLHRIFDFAATFVVSQLAGSDDIITVNHVSVFCAAIDTRDFIMRKLENFEFDTGTFEGMEA